MTNVIGINYTNNTYNFYIIQNGQVTDFTQGTLIEQAQAALNASQATGNDLYRSSSIDNHIDDELPFSTEIDELFNY